MYKASKLKSIPRFDFRSDTVTKPSLAMRQVIAAALVGDDVFDQDPTVHALGDKLKSLTHKPASLFCTSGTLANQVAVRCALDFAPPYSVVLHKDSHMNCYEAGGIPFHTGAQLILADRLTEDVVKALICTSTDVHYAPTRVVVLENTMNGQVMPLEEMKFASPHPERFLSCAKDWVFTCTWMEHVFGMLQLLPKLQSMNTAVWLIQPVCAFQKDWEHPSDRALSDPRHSSKKLLMSVNYTEEDGGRQAFSLQQLFSLLKIIFLFFTRTTKMLLGSRKKSVSLASNSRSGLIPTWSGLISLELE